MAKNMNYGDASNTSVRVYLTQAGIKFDKQNGLDSLNGKGYEKHRAIALEFQNSCCFYCDKPFEEENRDRDHVIPMNQEHGGIHCWGNVVYCCSKCNKEKNFFQKGDWKAYLTYKGKDKLYQEWIAKYPNGQDESLKLIKTCKEIYGFVDEYLRKKVSGN